MKHEELLKAIDFWINEIGDLDNAPVKALRAVVELHKPDLSTYEDGSGCECDNEYPCQTIQTIEKELV